MRRVLAVMRRNTKRSTKVADENMFREGNGVEFPVIAHHTRQGYTGLSIVYSILRAPLSLLSCLSSHPHSSADGAWVSGDLARMSEVNHLMVSDSMRYAILM
ncbi:hypothetical protein HanRHA438_Chr03g0124861 [Helianthus annuus]|uniref:Uncharacterized protein n=1 Tax=Helianthus annuus TaxID=4232 RepID=A0A251V8G8_HELAN|nr:hypothetical protein HanXRQr2_Chr03g0112921 [Helianthus annuus]KAJ0593183.1 hypothetical protein HanHA300_Chr03g0094191 [Helianthus annuus]KAJ0600996.1 hypothetical protein HanIR_Chr03g0123401 [Helianthus annuus]KAJ0608197.1 hypothetical protein HanHA89_Chr03g0105911 [Helianthus annuus]KAJ0768260.1 hypothetical protein HanLR1_Chr03g0099261 [Helianthus annuus]